MAVCNSDPHLIFANQSTSTNQEKMENPSSDPIMATKKAPQERKTKPERERMRRERENSFIQELKNLIIDKDHCVISGRIKKLEKADILERAVELIKNQESNAAKAMLGGYLRCLRDVERFFSSHQAGNRGDWPKEMINHLKKESTAMVSKMKPKVSQVTGGGDCPTTPSQVRMPLAKAHIATAPEVTDVPSPPRKKLCSKGKAETLVRPQTSESQLPDQRSPSVPPFAGSDRNSAHQNSQHQVESNREPPPLTTRPSIPNIPVKEDAPPPQQPDPSPFPGPFPNAFPPPAFPPPPILPSNPQLNNIFGAGQNPHPQPTTAAFWNTFWAFTDPCNFL